MSNITQFSNQSVKKLNRRIYLGPISATWTAPTITTEVEVHCWGGGASSVPISGGGGGGYVSHLYPVVSGQTLLITASGVGGTSTVSCPSQSPISPITATGGIGTTGGSGSYSIAPGISTNKTFASSGGFGGVSPTSAGGGGAGFIYGPGGNGSGAPGSGGGIRGNGAAGGGGGGFLPGNLNPLAPGGIAGGGGIGIDGNSMRVSATPWFYVEDITGRGGDLPVGSGGAGGAGGGGAANSDGGVFGGGGASRDGGWAGGGGNPLGVGGVGVVIIYW